MLKILSITIFLFSSSVILYGQQDTVTFHVGNQIINGEVINDYTNKWKVTHISEDGTQTPNKIWTDYGQIIELGGKKYFHRVQDLYDPQMNLLSTWINMVEHKTLVPVSNSTLSPKGKFLHIQFQNDKLNGISNQVKEGEVTTFYADFDEKVYDWNLYGMLLVGLPLKEGLIAKLPYYNIQSNDQKWLAISVTAKETMPLPDGRTVVTWKIETDNNLTFWISKSAPYVIKLESYRKDNSKLVWEVY